MANNLLILILEVGLLGFGVYALVRGVRSWPGITKATSSRGVWDALLPVLVWSVTAVVCLICGSLLGTVSLGIVFMALLLPTIVLGVGIIVAVIRSHRLEKIEAGGPAAGEQWMVPEEVLRFCTVKVLAKGRVRSLDENGAPVVPSDESLVHAHETQGRVQLLTWKAAQEALGGRGGPAPVLAFWSRDGDASFLLYHDDIVVLAH